MKEPIKGSIKGIFGLMLILILFFNLPVSGEVLGPFPELRYPAEFSIEGDRVYFNEMSEISIYSLNDLKLIKKFGKKGEGPKEFKLNDDGSVQLFVHDDCLQVNSVGRMSYFTRDGEFIRVQRSLEGSYLYMAGKNFVGWRRVYEDKMRIDTVNLYGPDLKRKKELFRQKNGIQPNMKKINTLTWFIDSLHRGYKNKIYICSLKGDLTIFDNEGKKLSTTHLPLEKVEVTSKAKKAIMRYYSHKDSYWKRRFERLKTWFHTPDTFPPVRYMYIADNRIYILTYKEKEEKTLCAVFDLNIKPVKQVFIPMAKESYIFFKPFCFKNNKLYQMMENEDTDEWEMHVNEVK